jgi:hypothetical protein
MSEAPTQHLVAIYHRLETPTQTPEDAAKQEASGEIWGRPARGGAFPKVKAYTGPLPPGARGIEFTTDVPPDANCPPHVPTWRGEREGVICEGDYAKIKARVTKNTQRIK